MQWTTKSSEPQSRRTSAKTASMVAGSVTSQWPTTAPWSSAASGSTRLLQRVALVGQREVGAVPARRLGDAPGDRAVVRDADDQAALARENARRRASQPIELAPEPGCINPPWITCAARESRGPP